MTELLHENLSDPIGDRAPVDHVEERATGGMRDIQERAEGSRREEWVTCALKDARAPRDVFAEATKQRRLSDPRLSADEHDSPSPAFEPLRMPGESLRACPRARGGASPRERRVDDAHGEIVVSRSASAQLHPR